MSGTQRHLSIWLVLIVGLISLRPRIAWGTDPRVTGPLDEITPSSTCSPSAQVAEDPEIPYSEFVGRVDRHQIASVVISGQSIQGVMRDGSFFSTMSPDTNHTGVVDALIRHNARVAAAPPPLLTGASATRLIGALDDARHNPRKPDVRGREEILRVHLRAVPLGSDVGHGTIARAAAGLGGARLDGRQRRQVTFMALGEAM